MRRSGAATLRLLEQRSANFAFDNGAESHPYLVRPSYLTLAPEVFYNVSLRCLTSISGTLEDGKEDLKIDFGKLFHFAWAAATPFILL